MIILATLSHGRQVKIETTSEIEAYAPNEKINFWVWGRRWIKSRQKFSGTVLGNAIRSYEIEEG